MFPTDIIGNRAIENGDPDNLEILGIWDKEVQHEKVKIWLDWKSNDEIFNEYYSDGCSIEDHYNVKGSVIVDRVDIIGMSDEELIDYIFDGQLYLL